MVLALAYPFIRKKTKNTDKFIAKSLLEKYGILNIEVQQVYFETGTNECGIPVGVFSGTFTYTGSEETHSFGIVRDSTPTELSVIIDGRQLLEQPACTEYESSDC